MRCSAIKACRSPLPVVPLCDGVQERSKEAGRPSSHDIEPRGEVRLPSYNDSVSFLARDIRSSQCSMPHGVRGGGSRRKKGVRTSRLNSVCVNGAGSPMLCST